jgi:hypothetical protein
VPRVVFGPWEPDKPPHLSTSLTQALNVYPAANGYRPIKQFSAVTGGALPARCLGAGSFVAPQGQSTIVAGTQTNLYRAQLSGWQSIGSGYGLQANGRWRFAQFGGLAIATNGTDNMVKIDLVSATTAALGGSPPKAKNLSVVKDFLVATVINGDVQTLAWSGINDAEWWTYGQNQSDYQIMPSGGEITGIFGGESGIILQRNRISRMTYVGDNVVFQFDEVSSNVGCVSMNSTAQWGTLGFFLSDTGFMMWDGASLKPIGQERVDRWYRNLYAHSSLDGMSTAIDPANSIVAWSFGDQTLIYNWVLDRWTVTSLTATIIFPGFTRDIALDELTTPYPVLDNVPYSLDDPFFKGGDPRFYVIDASNNLGTLTGGNMAAVLSMAGLELANGRDARIRMVRPLSDIDSGVTVDVGTTSRLGLPYTVTSYAGLAVNGDVPVRERGRYASMSWKADAGAAWSFIQGLGVEAVGGARQ